MNTRGMFLGEYLLQGSCNHNVDFEEMHCANFVHEYRIIAVDPDFGDCTLNRPLR